MIKEYSPEEIATLATSIAIALTKSLNKEELFIIKQLLNTICSLINLQETQCAINKKNGDK